MAPRARVCGLLWGLAGRQDGLRISRSITEGRYSPLRQTSSAEWRFFHPFSSAASALEDAEKEPWRNSMNKIRNIGISAHIDSGKTTLTERILFYTGRIHEIHEVKGRDGVGAKMDSMDLEREKGITIQSAATYCQWGETQINIIDTPGHVDFTIEVERALRVLDGAVLVLCSVGGVQSQSITVDRQMRRYNVPRVAFINKLDRTGADPWRVLAQLRAKLRHNAAAVQVPIGAEGDLAGLVDLIDMKAHLFEGQYGEVIREEAVPAELAGMAAEKRRELIEAVSEADDELAEMFLEDRPISADDLRAAVRRATLSLNFTPVFMGSAFKNKGVQKLLDGVIDFLPSPLEVENIALDQKKKEEKDIAEAKSGEIVAMFGVDCATGDTFTDGSVNYTMTSMNVPEPVMSLSITPNSKEVGAQTIISGMGELHLDIYVERIRREYKVEATVGKPQVNFREAISERAEFDYTHRKQSGGQGQYGRVCGYIEPLSEEDAGMKFEFQNDIVGQAIPSNFIPAIEKGFREAANSGALIGFPVEGLRCVLTDGASHAVDSSELAFKLAAVYAFRQCYEKAAPVILEPVMVVDVKAPVEFQGVIIGNVNRRKGVIVGSDQEGDDVTVLAHVPLNNMFGYSTDLRSMTQGKGEFTMEYLQHGVVPQDVQMQLVSEFKQARSAS